MLPNQVSLPCVIKRSFEESQETFQFHPPISGAIDNSNAAYVPIAYALKCAGFFMHLEEKFCTSMLKYFILVNRFLLALIQRTSV